MPRCYVLDTVVVIVRNQPITRPSRRFLMRAYSTAQQQQLTTRASSRTHSTVAVASMQRINGLNGILDQCSGVLLDQFGVLHDGKRPYPHAVAAVKQLADAGKRVVILSNSSRRSGGTIGKLAKMGFDETCFAGVWDTGL